MSSLTSVRQVVVVGAGPAGLAVSACLSQRGLDVVVLERASAAASAWRSHYERLHLHTARRFSQLPGLAIPRSEGRYVSRAGVVRYLDRYAAHHGLEIRTGVQVSSLERQSDSWRVGAGEEDLIATNVVVATGYNNTPAVPRWPGLDGFEGEVVHASSYHSGADYAGRDVLVVGVGNTGAEIAVDLAERGARRVRIAVRTPPHILRRELLGMPAQVTGLMLRYVPSRWADAIAEPVRRRTIPDLTPYGLADPGPGVYSRAARGQIPVLDVGFVEAVRRGDVEPVAAVIGFEGARVRLADGTTNAPDVVIVATGYRRALEPLVGHLGVLDEAGNPAVHGARTHPGAPGLYFIGFTNPVSGMFREIALDARRIARAVAGGGGRPAAASPSEGHLSGAPRSGDQRWRRILTRT